jgi:hypothetical protein
MKAVKHTVNIKDLEKFQDPIPDLAIKHDARKSVPNDLFFHK